MNETYSDFLAKQDGIYNRFRGEHLETVRIEGTQRDGGAEMQSAWLIAWRFGEKLTSLVAELSEEVASMVPALTYGPDNAHTTVSDFDLRKDYHFRTDHARDWTDIHNIGDAVKAAFDRNKRVIQEDGTVFFQDLLVNPSTVVIAGTPSRTLWQTNRDIMVGAAANGVQLKGSWGAHMTMNRFLEASGKEVGWKLADFIVNNSVDLGVARPVALEFGYFNTDPENGFVFNASEATYEITKPVY